MFKNKKREGAYIIKRPHIKTNQGLTEINHAN